MGCDRGCDFCTTTTHFGGERHVLVTAEQVKTEMKMWQQYKPGTDHIIYEEDQDKEFINEVGRLLREDPEIDFSKLGPVGARKGKGFMIILAVDSKMKTTLQADFLACFLTRLNLGFSCPLYSACTGCYHGGAFVLRMFFCLSPVTFFMGGGTGDFWD